jgi:5-hydroxyisourate hydrolase-like protein (transthyretin family)
MSRPGSPSSGNSVTAHRRGHGTAKWWGAALLVIVSAALAVMLFRQAAPTSDAAGADTAASAPSLNIEMEPRQSVSGTALQPVPAVLLTDAQGRPAAGVVVQAVLQSGSLAPGSVAQATTDSEGRATFEALKVEKAGAYRLDFSAAGYPAAQTAEFVVRFGFPRVLTIVREPQGGSAGAPVGGDPAVRVTDEAGNPIPGIDVDVLLEPATGAQPGKLARVRSNGEGLAVFSDLVVPAPGSDYRLKFEARAAGVNHVLSSPFSLTNS